MVTVAIAGVGEIGAPIARAFLAKGHQVRVLTRQGKTNSAVEELAAQGATKVEVDYGNGQSIESALRNVDVIISALNPASAVNGESVEVLLARKAAREPSVKLFIPSMWGFDYQSETVMHPSTVNPIVLHKTDIFKQLSELQLPWIAISNGLFSSWSLTPFAGIDAKSRAVHLKIRADQEVTFTHLDDIGRFVEAVVDQPRIYPSPGSGKWLYVASYHATFAQVLQEAERIDGQPWSISYDDPSILEKRQQEANMEGVLAWSIASLGNGRAFRRDNDNDLVGFTPKHTLQSAIKEALERAK